MKRIASCWSLLVLLGACAPSQGPGDGAPTSGSATVRLVVEAEDTITDGIAAQTGGSGGGFVDGWSLEYTRFWVSVGHVALADQQGARIDVPMTASGGDRVFDLRNSPTTELFTVSNVDARRYDRVSFRTAVVDTNTVFPESIAATAAERAAMTGNSVWLKATARKGTRTISIEWMFAASYEYSQCEGPADRPGTGIVLAQGGTTTVRLTIHGDHWYWQTFALEGSPTRFDPIANADTTGGPYRGNGDGFTSLAELDQVNLADIPSADGTLNPGGRPVTTLGDYMRQTTGTLGHLDGDGICLSRRLP